MVIVFILFHVHVEKTIISTCSSEETCGRDKDNGVLSEVSN